VNAFERFLTYMTKIKSIKAREILDSRSIPTVEVKIVLEGGFAAKASVPSGTSTGIHEALELRDKGERFNGLGVRQACHNIESDIARQLIGLDARDQQKIDKLMIELDGTQNKSRLGANATLAVSLACARVAAVSLGVELWQYLRDVFHLNQKLKLPIPLFNVFNGGKHADTNLDFQEFMVIPEGIKGTDPESHGRFSEQLRTGSEIFHKLGEVLLKKGFDTDTGIEGGYAPDIDSSVQAIELILEGVQKAGFSPGEEIFLGIDAGASELYDGHSQRYNFQLDDSHLSRDQLISLWQDWVKKYPFIILEDPLWQDDWQGWQQITRELTVGSRPGQDRARPNLMVVGDDFFVTNPQRLKLGIEKKIANAVIVKPNQVGTLTETINFAGLAKSHGYKIIVSHRSGETSDDFIADLGAALGADYIKAGAPARGERVAKYNRLLEIEETLKNLSN